MGANQKIIRGSTPMLEFNLPFEANTLTKLEVYFKQDGKDLLTKTLSDITIDTTDAKKIYLTLTEAETLSFLEDVELYLQLRCGVGTNRMVSEIKEIEVLKLLKGGAL